MNDFKMSLKSANQKEILSHTKKLQSVTQRNPAALKAIMHSRSQVQRQITAMWSDAALDHYEDEDLLDEPVGAKGAVRADHRVQYVVDRLELGVVAPIDGGGRHALRLGLERRRGE